ncbi:hypothetical protein V6N12_072043 [Hibiscus sabdariffa]|uniref:Uncharacterized protein n=1 Tax=Hibiscus sabdariffa TaxID=183260 RepID=A0ABR2FLZ2_9ROSI
MSKSERTNVQLNARKTLSKATSTIFSHKPVPTESRAGPHNVLLRTCTSPTLATKQNPPFTNGSNSITKFGRAAIVSLRYIDGLLVLVQLLVYY